MHVPLTAILLTQDEEMNIADCLGSLDWVEDVVLVDSGSTDSTLSLAKRVRPDVRVFNHAFKDFGDQRNWALDHTDPRHDWVLFLDADERSTGAFSKAVEEAIMNPGACVGYFLAARNYFRGRWLKRVTLYPSWQLRLLKRGEVRFQREGHGQREVTTGTLERLEEPYDHYPLSKGLEEWRRRHEAYAAAEVDLLERLAGEPLKPAELLAGNPLVRRRCLKRLAARVGFRPFFKFVYLFILRLGFLDGRAGFAYCMLRVEHDRNIEKQWALRRAQMP